MKILAQLHEQKLLEILSHPPSMLLLKVELAAVIDLGEHFVKGTYRLEGDGYLVLSCYEEILKIRNAIRIEHYANLQAIVRQAFPDNNDLQKQWVAYSIGYLQADYGIFRRRPNNGSEETRSVQTDYEWESAIAY